MTNQEIIKLEYVAEATTFRSPYTDKKIFDEFKDSPLVVHGISELFYKGFKVKEDGRVLDIKDSDFYDDPTAEETELILKFGFIEGTKKAIAIRHELKVKYYLREIEKAEASIKRFRRLYKLRPAYHGFLTKRQFLKEYRRKLLKRIATTEEKLSELVALKNMYNNN